MPVEAGTWIGLAPRRDVAVPDHRIDSVAIMQLREESAQDPVLNVLEWKPVTTLEFNADGKVVAVLAAPPGRNARMPGTSGAGNELDQFAVAANQEVGRNP